MRDCSRRVFLKASGAAGLAATCFGTWSRSVLAQSPKRRFTMDLRCGSIGVRADQREAIELAHRFGFESVEPSAHFLAKLSDGKMDELLAE